MAINPASHKHYPDDYDAGLDSSGQPESSTSAKPAEKRQKTSETSHAPVRAGQSGRSGKADVNAGARSMIASFVGRAPSKEKFQESREAVLKQLVAQHAPTPLTDDQLQRAVAEKLSARPDVEEMALHLEKYGAALEHSPLPSPKYHVITGPELPPDVEAELLRDVQPLAGKKVLFERGGERGGAQRYLEYRDDVGQLAQRSGQIWMPQDLVDTVRKDVRKAHDRGQPYTFRYLASKAQAGRLHSPAAAEATTDDTSSYSDHRTSYIRTYGSGDTVQKIQCKKAGKYFTGVGGAGHFVNNVTKFHEIDRFIQALNRPFRKSHLNQDILGALKYPVETFEMEGKTPAHHYTIERHCITVGQNDEPFHVYLALRGEMVLTTRIMHADSDASELFNSIARGMVGSHHLLGKIVSAGGKLTSVSKLDDKFTSSHSGSRRAVTFHAGTPYERRLQCLPIAPSLVLQPSALFQYKEIVDLLKNAAASDASYQTVAKMLDHEVRRYEGVTDPRHPDKQGEHYLYLNVIKSPDGIDIGFAPRLVAKDDPTFDEGKTIKSIFPIGRTRYSQESPVVTAHKQEGAPFNADIPGTAGVKLKPVRKFAIPIDVLESAVHNRHLPGFMQGPGLSPLVDPRSLVMKALESCTEPTESYPGRNGAVIDRYKIRVDGKTFNVYAGHHADRLKNAICYLEIGPAKLPDDGKKNRMLESLADHATYRAISGAPSNSMAPSIAIPEQPSEPLFHVEIDGHPYALIPAGDFVVTACRLGKFKHSSSLGDHDKGETKRIVNEKCLPKVRTVHNLERMLIENAKPSSDPHDINATFQTDRYKIAIYDSEVAGEKFKLAVVTPTSQCENLVAAMTYQHASMAKPYLMVARLRSATPDKFIEILVGLRACQENNKPMPPLLEIPGDLQDKIDRLQASGSLAAGDGDAMDVDSDVDDAMDVDGDDRADADNASAPAADLSDSIKPYTSDESFYERIAQGIDALPESAAIDQIDAAFGMLNLGDGDTLRAGEEHLQLEALGNLWRGHVRHAPVPGEPVNKPRIFNDLAADYWRANLRPSVTVYQGSWTKQKVTAWAMARPLLKKMSPLFKPLGMRVSARGNVHELLICFGRKVHKYEHLLHWITNQQDGGIGAARQFLAWMNGKTSLIQLPEHLRMLAVISHLAEVARGYATDLPRLKEYMEEIATVEDSPRESKEDLARAQWNKLAEDYPPVRDADADENVASAAEKAYKKAMQSAGSPSSAAGADETFDWGGLRTELASIVDADEDPDIERTLKTDAAADLESLMPKWAMQDDLKDKLLDRFGVETAAFIMLKLAQRSGIFTPVDPEHAYCAVNSGTGKPVNLFVTHDGETITDVAWPDDTPGIHAVKAIAEDDCVFLAENTVRQLRQDYGADADLVERLLAAFKDPELDYTLRGDDELLFTAESHAVTMTYKDGCITGLEFAPLEGHRGEETAASPAERARQLLTRMRSTHEARHRKATQMLDEIKEGETSPNEEAPYEPVVPSSRRALTVSQRMWERARSESPKGKGKEKARE
jgi:hypothetical protein